ncbi:enoyl-ACP reductase [Geothrix sp. PMB-07]|uniref:enoyl-ACP reductase FabI n=1 Tax=Geothrix sp. PMB-07 TaxID=3068640 RepID=UPI0027421B24|nr:enoyl-ACP reductase [Geothrix sp. PMB-07]WLT30598.1 enoyl-ACP reductase [Geothrix sp. PMB-07]
MVAKGGLLEGKRGLIIGVANKRSIAWGIAQRAQEAGAHLCLTYQNERLGENVRELAAELKNPLLQMMDVGSDSQIVMAFDEIRKKWGKLDFVVHAVAYAPRGALEGRFMDTSREDFRVAHDISAYSLAAVSHAAQPLMTEGGSIITLSYLGAERVVPGYNVMGVAKASLEATVRYLAADLGPMGIRVNAVSAGPIKTLAASAIPGIGTKLKQHRSHTPLQKDTDQLEVGDAGVFLLSDMGRGVTGQVLYVDGGFSIMAG